MRKVFRISKERHCVHSLYFNNESDKCFFFSASDISICLAYFNRSFFCPNFKELLFAQVNSLKGKLFYCIQLLIRRNFKIIFRYNLLRYFMLRN